MLAFSAAAPAFIFFILFLFFIFCQSGPRRSDKSGGKHGSPLPFWGKAQSGDLPLPLTMSGVIINLCHLFSQFDNIQGFPCPLLKQSFRVSFFFLFPQKRNRNQNYRCQSFQALRLGVCVLTCKLWDLLCVPGCAGASICHWSLCFAARTLLKLSPPRGRCCSFKDALT